MEFIRRNTDKRKRNGGFYYNNNSFSVNNVTSTVIDNYLPAEKIDDENYTVNHFVKFLNPSTQENILEVTEKGIKVNGNILATKEVTAWGDDIEDGDKPVSTSIDVIDNLDSTSTDSALSANQGRILKDLIDNIEVDVDLSNYFTKLESDARFQPIGNYLTSHQSLANYVTLNTEQTITKTKKFSDYVMHENSMFFKNKAATDGIYFVPATYGGLDVYGHSNYSYKKYLGSITDNGELVFDSFKKNGGTSSQFLKADGSVDSNTYALSSSLANYVKTHIIADSTDISSITENGFLFVNGDSNSNTMVNSPFTNGFAMLTHTCLNDNANDIRRPRIAFNAYGDMKIFNDRSTGGLGGTWYDVITTKNANFAKKGTLTTEDLDSINDFGILCSPTNANATTERHYPINQAGTLFYGTGAYNRSCQIYGAHYSNRWFARGAGSGIPGTHTAWKEFAFKSDIFPDADYSIRAFKKPDNGGRPVVLLISDITEWKGKTAIDKAFGFVGTIMESRFVGNSYEQISNVICKVQYTDSTSDSYRLLKSSSNSVLPKIIKDTTNNKYYLGIQFYGSEHNTTLTGYFRNCLSSFISVNFILSNGTAVLPTGYEDITSQYGGTVTNIQMNVSNAVYANQLSTSRTIWGQSFNGTGNISGRWELDGVNGGSLSIFDGTDYKAIQSYNRKPLCLNPISNNVGIGTTNPAYKLDVNGTIKSTSNISADGSILTKGDGSFGGNLTLNGKGLFNDDVMLNDNCMLILDSGRQIFRTNIDSIRYGSTIMFGNNTAPSINNYNSLTSAKTTSGYYWGLQQYNDSFGFYISRSAGKCENSTVWNCVNGDLKHTGNLIVTGEVSAYSPSDRRLKKDIESINNATEIINKLNPVSFKWNDKAKELNNSKDDRTNYGLIAQEVEETLPSLVHEIYGEYKSLDYEQLISILIKSNQELSNKLEEEKKRNDDLESRILEIEKLLN